MKNQIAPSIKAHLIRGAFYLLSLVSLFAIPFAMGQWQPHSHHSQRTLTFAQRVAYQRAIEDVYWRHRIWPKERPDSKPSLDAVMSQAQVEKKVADYLRKSQALQDYWQQSLTTERLQAEMDRMAQYTKRPEVLHELFASLGNDPFVIAECLARPILTERIIANLSGQNENPNKQFVPAQANAFRPISMIVKRSAEAVYTLPQISVPTTCTEDTWTATSLANVPSARDQHTAVWTGSEMIVWGGYNGSNLNTGGRYDPATDSWMATTTTNAPSGRRAHTAVWTGSEMIIWGGSDGTNNLDTGGRYTPGTDSWTATSTTNAPASRAFHTAVWTGSKMIVWGGRGNVAATNTGGRYDPSTDSWTATSTTNVPDGRDLHTAVWSVSTNEMIVWGGTPDNVTYFNTGGRYNPSTDSWTATTLANAPSGRDHHTAVWTGSEMIVWGGFNGSFLNTGGRYDPATDSWMATTITNAPIGRRIHTAVWTLSEMIVWGGENLNNRLNRGGRYDPSADSWIATSTINVPDARYLHTAVWSDSTNEMIVWGGTQDNVTYFNTGGRYCTGTSSSTPTPTPTATATATPTATGTLTPTPTATATSTATGTLTPTPTASPSVRPTLTPRILPTPRPRPTPPPRP
jgi:N-acetylneuraminic acid mutarotase